MTQVKPMVNNVDSGDGNLWVGIAGLAVAAASGLLGWLAKGFAWANKDGKSSGEIAEWRRSMESRMSAMEEQKNRNTEALRMIPDRLEMNAAIDRIRSENRDGFSRIDDRLEKMDAFLHEVRNTR